MAKTPQPQPPPAPKPPSRPTEIREGEKSINIERGQRVPPPPPKDQM